VTITQGAKGPLVAPFSLAFARKRRPARARQRSRSVSNIRRTVTYVQSSPASASLVHGRAALLLLLRAKVLVADPSSNSIVALGSDLTETPDQPFAGVSVPPFKPAQRHCRGLRWLGICGRSASATAFCSSAADWRVLHMWPIVVARHIATRHMCSCSRHRGILVSDPTDGVACCSTASGPCNRPVTICLVAAKARPLGISSDRQGPRVGYVQCDSSQVLEVSIPST